MVAMKLATIAVLATVAVAAPATTATTTTEAKPFSFSQWVDDIINPDVVALTPEQAVEAYYQSINATTSTHDGTVKAKRVEKHCFNDDLGWRADVDAAVKCVNEVAALGSSVRYTVKPGVEVCRDIPGVKIKVDPGYPDTWEVTAQQLAIAGGHIMDACTWGGRTGGMIFEEWNRWMEIDLRSK